MDEKIKTAKRKNTMSVIQTVHPNYITFYAGKLRAHSNELGAWPPVFEKSVAESKPNLIRCNR